MLMIFIRCDKETLTNEIEDISTKNGITQLEFHPTFNVELRNGMLVFESKLAFDVTKLEIAEASRDAVDLWEEKIGIKTYASMFYKVIYAEDSISKYYESLPIDQQKYWLNQPEIHSTIYYQALEDKILQVQPDGEGGEYFDDCTQFLNCTFVIRAEAQKKNFWGNWTYSDYFPSLTINASWTYSYRDYSSDSYISYGCGLYDCEKNYVSSYSCTSNPSYLCPTSPHSAYYPSVNNAFINLTPHGIWSSSPKNFSDAFTVHGVLSATIDGKIFNYNW